MPPARSAAPIPPASLWLLHAGPFLAELCLPCRSRCQVRLTDLATSASTLLCRANGPVLQLHVARGTHATSAGPGGGGAGGGSAGDGGVPVALRTRSADVPPSAATLCVATACSSLECWRLPTSALSPRVLSAAEGGGGDGDGSAEGSAEAAVLGDVAAVRLAGSEAVRRHAALPSRTQVLTEYDSGGAPPQPPPTPEPVLIP